jgi:thiol-disulfide isomerase/thioredoxin
VIRVKLPLLFAIVLLQLPAIPVLAPPDSTFESERKIIEYLRQNLKNGEPVIITALYNEVFTSVEDRKALDRLYNIFFKVPAFVAQYYASAHNPPSLQQIAMQFNLKVPGEVDVILKIIEYDRRIPKFILRDSQTGEISHVDIEKIRSDPRFNRIIERTLTGWVGKPAPQFSAQLLDGGTLKLAELNGTVRLLYFWFSHCPPCKQITPHLVSLQRMLRAKGFTVISLNADNLLELGYSDAEREAYVKEHGINFPVAHLTSEIQAAYGGVQLFPTLFLLNRDGTVEAHFVNYQTEAKLKAAIDKIL